MRKIQLLRRLFLVMFVGSFMISASPAFAVKQFYDEFKEVYVNNGELDASAVAKAKCNLCHEGKSKKNKNAYGKLLDTLLDRKKDAKNPEKIREALAKVESEKSSSGVTYGELFKEGKLP
jgi:cytochrome c2